MPRAGGHDHEPRTVLAHLQFLARRHRVEARLAAHEARGLREARPGELFQCRRVGSLDSAIRDAEFNDLASLLERAPGLCGFAHNGGESARAMRRTAGLGLPVWALPSSSPANASWSFERKLAAWRQAFEAAGVLR